VEAERAGLGSSEKERARLRMTCADAMKRYDGIRRQLKSHREDARLMRVWTAHLGGKRLSEVVRSDVDTWRASELLRGRKPSGINRDVAYIARIFSLAREDRLTDNDPFRGLRKLKAEGRVRWLSLEELDRLKAAMRPEDFELVVIAWRMGFRQGEQFGLRRQDVNFQTGLVFVREGKTGSRHVPMSKAVREILLRRLASHSSEWVFPDPTGRGQKHQSAKNFYTRRYRPACEEAGLQDVTWHDLRHTFCSHLVQAGVPLFQVGALAGHSDPVMTKRYAHLVPENLRAAVSIFDVWGTSSEERPEE
jgi:integrase